ncbi:hypothetical protein [Aestuariivivens sediminis]|uniref:hypothetical protein n=1 Tax=Aestuariivivens sediminis TaxID=2913557 RepID=UPI001F581B41|nr:hypothetical protein [Aestuariivivens sediminis]
MHKTVAVSLVFLYVIAMLRPIQPYLEYALNHEYIANFLCMNKEKPELQCNGKCHLTKELKKQQEQEPFSALSVSMEHYPIGFVTIFQINGLSICSLNVNHIYSYNRLYQFNYCQDKSQPPELV